MTIIQCLQDTISKPRLMLAFFAAISAAALGMAYIAQYGYGLAPCELCLYQRVPYAAVIILGIAGAILARQGRFVAPVFLGLIAFAFYANTAIAAYHTGVERGWWESFLRGCSIPSLEGSITDVLAQIQAAPVAFCNEIPWTDPVMGLSMANYNVLFCLGLGGVASITLCRSLCADKNCG